MSNKYCWVWNIKQECVEEYVKMHNNPWPEIMEAHTRAGFKNYSIFQNPNKKTEFFYVFECDGDAQKAFDLMEDDEYCKKWNAITSKMIDHAMEGEDVSSGVDYMTEVFYLP